MIKLSSLLNESTTDGSIESLLQVTRIATRMGVFDDEMIRDVKHDFIAGISGILKFDLSKVPSDKKKEFKNVVSMIIKLMQQTTDMNSFVKTLTQITHIKTALFRKYGISENLNESKTGKYKKIFKNLSHKLTTLKTNVDDWWNSNKQDIKDNIVNFLHLFVGAILKNLI